MVNLVDSNIAADGICTSQTIAVHKFGGSSLASQPRVNNVSRIISQYSNADDIIVVSANGDITDWLVEFNQGNREVLSKIQEFYQELAISCLADPVRLLKFFEESIHQLTSRQLSEDEVLSFGEIWSAKLLVELLNEKEIPSLFVDSRELLITDSIDDYQAFDLAYFDRGFEKAVYGNFGKRLIVTGYIAKSLCDETITLGRNGSDYTATLLARFSGAESVTLWTDVQGIYTADPRLVKNATPIVALTYDEAKSLAAVGTNVLHQKTIGPLRDQNIPLFVRSSLNPSRKGTQVSQLGDHNEIVKSVALKPDLVKINISHIDELRLAEIQHQLFENHIVSLGADWNESTGSFSILLESSLLQKAKVCLEQTQIEFDVQKEHRAVIAIVGNGIAKNENFLVELEYALAERIQFRVVNQHHKNAIYLVTQETNTTRTLEKIYQASFDVAAEMRLKNSPLTNSSHVEQQTVNEVVV
ncbi:MAG: aspartate kinase [Kangiellaceae bacterium]|nr:aspartate kinase [Kangiellaceae bacterium]MCW8999548.1 aspartate kinase [Kangiellaceae bacterium]